MEKIITQNWEHKHRKDGTKYRMMGVYSSDFKYRYLLKGWIPKIDNEQKPITFLGLNPSHNTKDDHSRTLSRVIDFCQKFNHSEFNIVNLFPLVDSDSVKVRLWKIPKEEHDKNFFEVNTCIHNNIPVVLMWGSNMYTDRILLAQNIFKLLNTDKINLFALAINKNGSPKHPLFTKLSNTVYKVEGFNNGTITNYKLIEDINNQQ